MIAALALALFLQAPTDPVRAPVVSARVSPEAPAIGEPITVELRVRAPAGTLVRFPVLPDTGTRIEPLDPRALRDASTAEFVDRTAIYRLIAWDTGTVDVAFSDVTLTMDGAERRYAVRLPDIRVRSVLPADTALRVPREARGPRDALSLRWRLWVALAVIAWLGWWGLRRWRARRAEIAAMEANDAARKARDAFAHAAALDLISAGEPGRHLLAHTAALRQYLGVRWPMAAPHLTAAELAEALPASDFPILPDRLVALVARAEAVAFAQAPLAAEEAERLGIEATGIVEDLETAWTARRTTDEARLRSARIRRKPLR